MSRMTGPEHYRKAQDLLAEVETGAAAGLDGYVNEHRIRKAQAHATLALVAATALGAAGSTPGSHISGEWRRQVVA